MRKFAITGIVVLLALAFAACGGSKSASGSCSANTVKMEVSTFGCTTLTVKSGTTVTFDNTVNGGGTHILLTGNSASFSAETGAPADLDKAAGLNFSPGDKKTETFTTAGTYHITCTIHPAMNLTITVQ
jgi:plastocyanin